MQSARERKDHYQCDNDQRLLWQIMCIEEDSTRDTHETKNATPLRATTQWWEKDVFTEVFTFLFAHCENYDASHWNEKENGELSQWFMLEKEYAGV